MITKRNFEKEYPEPPECEVNGSQCEFDVECICHNCGKNLCKECTTHIRHQPRLPKYVGRILTPQRAVEARAEAHCDECKQNHRYSLWKMAIGAIITLLGIFAIFVGSDMGALSYIPGVISTLIEEPQVAEQVILGLPMVQLITLGVSGIYVLSILLNLLRRDLAQILFTTLLWVFLLTVLTVTSIPALILGWLGVVIGYNLFKTEYMLKKPFDYSLKRSLWELLSGST